MLSETEERLRASRSFLFSACSLLAGQRGSYTLSGSCLAALVYFMFVV